LSLWVATTLFLLVFVLTALTSIFYFTPDINQVNLVILGISGPGHEGSALTDTIIFSSISKKGTILLSVPRDIWYPPLKTKINTLYYYGEKKGKGLELTKEVLGEILGQKIDYGIVVDFNTFEKIVDLVGGIDVNVQRPFDDFHYPIAGKEDDLCSGDPEYRCRYEPLHFDAGLQHMNGETALKFVRSRNAEGDEGTDFARSARQEKVISALKQKFLTPAFFLDKEKLLEFWKIFDRQVETDYEGQQIRPLLKMLLVSRARKMSSFVLDGLEDKNGLLYHPAQHSSGQWVLLPKDDNFGRIHQFVQCLISREDKASCIP